MTTFVLVHGAWGGAHGFRHVRRLLRSRQHDVWTPSLTGVGERIHLSSPQVGLSTHIRDVVNHVLYEDLDQIVLVGFSYGGFVVTGALEHIAERVAHLVYLDAFVPGNGESVWSHLGRAARSKIELGQDWLVTGPARGYDSPAEGEWMAARRTTHPQGCFTEPVFLSQPLERYPFTRTYIKATQAPEDDIGNDAFWRAARHAKESPAWRYQEIATNHVVANNRPEELARILAEIA
ncbi:alpha/beta hydrolase [Bradyrhizobium sp. CB1650]|uniref:alpha/beta hydrolase n=1 Tax=Bradyrhizobium sp. CB1650 TaxID=3039153 RepID=UPI002434C575|nr:alpha/beta hydrolase [Bradyrhizobium sp. CB1650]WGD50771.1 alpha/beta hydrolase [Bradyrhizobium sp. CB1650]